MRVQQSTQLIIMFIVAHTTALADCCQIVYFQRAPSIATMPSFMWKPCRVLKFPEWAVISTECLKTNILSNFVNILRFLFLNFCSVFLCVCVSLLFRFVRLSRYPFQWCWHCCRVHSCCCNFDTWSKQTMPRWRHFLRLFEFCQQFCLFFLGVRELCVHCCIPTRKSPQFH